MYRLLVWIPILLLVLTACSPQVPVTVTGATGTPATPRPGASPAAPTSTPQTGVTSSTPGSAPMIPYSTPTPPGPRATPVIAGGWKEYTNSALQVSLSVPEDWSISSDSEGATFTPPDHGVPIQLAISSSNPAAEPLPNTRCTTYVNEHGVSIDNCFDTVAFTYNASFTIHGRMLSLSTTQHADVAVYDTMLNSVQEAG